MLLTAGVGCAEQVFAASFLEFEVVSYFFAIRMIAKNQSIRWVFKPKAFHDSPCGIDP